MARVVVIFWYDTDLKKKRLKKKSKRILKKSKKSVSYQKKKIKAIRDLFA